VLVPWQTGMVHLGFKKAFDVIHPQLDRVLARLSARRTLWYCGHSLGAALATLAADHHSGTRGVCTFGSPGLATVHLRTSSIRSWQARASDMLTPTM
jgi:pimeloyl-ACP methyl ester carboxylesterase